ncbi:Acetyltransferase (GNAT) family protein [Planctopirus ephydatiae]|uniref:Acetyltransferase (GNAT) family protein n=1 Tax=Planctopirus ephydatiae TaxID=2528019 RepID=A0A518GHT5_9PLAN|nr:GNAT family N-acetyltransferase [Planctopirus ephydatiae]QDV28156.1 Acetyltransferase (GNAT) family protein [Planctopirus ephydatiae]
MSFALVTLASVDVEQIVEVQALVYPAEFCESDDVFRKKLALSDAYGRAPLAFGHRDQAFGLLASYAIAHPWHDAAPPLLHAADWELPAVCNVLHVHDVAVAPTFRGQKLATDLMNRLSEEAQQAGWQKLTLVAVRDSWPLWERFGFRAISPHQYANEPGFWMSRELSPGNC